MSFYSKWAYARVELEIMGVVVETRHVKGSDCQKTIDFLSAAGACQRYEWAVFVKRHIGKKTAYQRERRRRVENEKRRIEREAKNVNKTL